LLTLQGFNAPPIPLINGGGSAASAIDFPDWALVRMPVVFPALGYLTSGGLPAPGDGVESVSYSTDLTEELFFDSLCQCLPFDGECHRTDDCCPGSDPANPVVCWKDPADAGNPNDVKRCSACRQ